MISTPISPSSMQNVYTMLLCTVGRGGRYMTLAWRAWPQSPLCFLTKRSTLKNPSPALTTTTCLQWSQHPSGTARQPPSSLPEPQHHCHLACCLLLPHQQHRIKAATASEASNMGDDDNNFSLPPPSHDGQAQPLPTVQLQ